MPGDTKPHKARMAKKRRKIRKIGSLTDARRKLWQAVTTAEDILLDDETTDEMRLRAIHALQQTISTYCKVVEVGELEARLSELEQHLAQRPARAYA